MKTKFGRQMIYFVWQPLAGLVDRNTNRYVSSKWRRQRLNWWILIH